MKTIIVATDFSAEADNAMTYAAAAASEKGYKLVLYNLYKTSIHAMNARISGSELDQIFEWRRNKHKEISEMIAEIYHIETDVYFATGDFYEELLNCIQLHQADLLVMGMAEKSLEQDLLGNTTTEVIQRLKFPILSVPLNAKYNGIKHILFACDISRGVHRLILDRVRDFAADFGATVEVFYVRQKAEEISRDQELSLVDVSLTEVEHYYKQVHSSEIIKAIELEIAASKTELLVMVPYRHGFWHSLLHKSKTRVMASGNSVPLLSLPL
ncbi:universal stress protein [Pedobacter xixiisoli]|uniref:Nucleotide-binding universal stress protein, UspA family n=1 Tax=Pedobacter xixiisoli TaxID=1476464 RepID=A0A285ZUK6_9SPHI|nr:universal stress protein [Pedobacter xixiisoli]SOD13316.1 Nucleotide-binding universal stress protein, UspA family [Pedobacter xixiisoli]